MSASSWSRSSFGLRVDEMTHDRFALGMGRDHLFEFAITSHQALVLTQVFRLRDHDEGLEIDVGPFEIAIQTPSHAAPSRRLTPLELSHVPERSPRLPNELVPHLLIRQQPPDRSFNRSL
jgi:hypothetical protein